MSHQEVWLRVVRNNAWATAHKVREHLFSILYEQGLTNRAGPVETFAIVIIEEVDSFEDPSQQFAISAGYEKEASLPSVTVKVSRELGKDYTDATLTALGCDILANIRLLQLKG